MNIARRLLRHFPAFLLAVTSANAGEINATFNSATEVPVTGTAYVAAGNTLNLSLNFAPPAGTKLTVVQNNGLQFIQGTFANIAQGQQVKLSFGGITYRFVANYFGGTGNDLVLQWADTRLLVWGNNPNPTPQRTMTDISADPAFAGKTIVDFTAGAIHSIVLCSDGSLITWGDNTDGQLGNGTFYSSSPTQVVQGGVLSGKSVISISAGRYHNVALCSDGTIAAWGDNSNGQLGNNSRTDSSVPLAVDRTGVLAGKTVVGVFAGQAHSLALCSDGTLAAWGSNQYFQLGNADYAISLVPVSVNTSGALAGKMIVSLDVGSNHSLALCSDGSLVSWGYNAYGQLGNNSISNSNVPVTVNQTGVLSGRTVSAVSCGNLFSVVSCTDGRLASWGRNGTGQLGNGTGSDRSNPGLVSNTAALNGKTVTALDAGFNHALAVCSDGSLAAWGYNYYWPLGVNTATDTNPPVTVSTVALRAGERWAGCATGDIANHSLGLVASLPPPTATTLAATGINDTKATLKGSVNAAGAVTAVSFEYGFTTSYGNVAPAVPASVSGTTTVALNSSLTVLLPGRVYHYRVVATNANGTTKSDDLTFVTTAAATLSQLTPSSGTLGPSFSPDHANYAVTVPNSLTEIILTPTVADTSSTVTVNGIPHPSGTASQPISLDVGSTAITVAVTAADGTNTFIYTVNVTRLPGVLNFNAQTDVPVSAEGFSIGGDPIAVTLGYAPAPGTNLTLLNNTSSDRIYGNFNNLAQGQLVRLSFGRFSYSFVTNYYGGDGNDLVLHWASNRLMAWGDNASGILGNNSQTSSLVPVSVAMNGVLAGKTVISVATGAQHTLALCSDGSLATWGYNGFGQLGNNSTTDSLVPVAVHTSGVLAGKRVVAIDAGFYHCMVLCSDGTVAGWGRAGNGQLANDQLISAEAPVVVAMPGAPPGQQVVAISCGADHSVARFADGTLLSWGVNQDGQLGNSSTTNSYVPTAPARGGVLWGKQIASAVAFGGGTFARCTDGTWASWGAGGGLGNNTTTSSSVPVMIDVTSALSGRSIATLSARGGHCLALCTDGSPAGWGNNYNGELGSNNASQVLVPTPFVASGAIAGKRITNLAAGSYYSLAVCSDGSMAAWGYNGFGQLGNGTITSNPTPVPVSTTGLRSGERYVAGFASVFHSVALVATPLPDSTTFAASQIMAATATLNGNANANGNATTVSFEYGLDTSYGLSAPGTPSSISGNTVTTLKSNLSGLLPGTTYHYRTVASNNAGVSRGTDMTFTTSTPPGFSGYAISTPFQTATTASLNKLLAKATDPDGDTMSVTATGPASASGGTSVLQASGILYTPPAGFSGVDTFPVTITDARGASAVGIVTVTVGQTPTAGGVNVNPPQITSLPGGQIGLKFQGIPGRTYQIQRSTDMNEWSGIATVTADAFGAMTFTDESSPQPSAFYRIALP